MRLTAEPYQILARDFLLNHERAGGFIGTGLGKTAATLSALCADPGPKGALVVAPLRVANLTWPNEVRKWDQFHWMKVENLRHGPPSGTADLYLINPESLHRLKDLSFCDTVIFDELTKFKNHGSKRARALRPMLNSHRRWGLTGTPRPNSLLELFGQIRMLDDGERLGKSFDHFKHTYFTAEDYMEYNWVPKEGAADTIYRKIADLVITLRASDYLDIADTEYEDVNVPLPAEAKQVYEELEKKLWILIQGKEIVAQSAATLVNKMLQITGGTVYDASGDIVKIHSAKIDALRALLATLGKERAIIATNYIHERERVCAEIPGCTDASKFKGDIEDAWNCGRLGNLVADPRSLGHGLNLQQGGRTVIWFSPNWSRELFDQTVARVARKGQKDVPRVYRLLCPGTIDDCVVETLRNRGDEQSAMMQILTNFQILGRE